jgi:hypothetical protein
VEGRAGSIWLRLRPALQAALAGDLLLLLGLHASAEGIELRGPRRRSGVPWSFRKRSRAASKQSSAAYAPGPCSRSRPCRTPAPHTSSCRTPAAQRGKGARSAGVPRAMPPQRCCPSDAISAADLAVSLAPAFAEDVAEEAVLGAPVVAGSVGAGLARRGRWKWADTVCLCEGAPVPCMPQAASHAQCLRHLPSCPRD